MNSIKFGIASLIILSAIASTNIAPATISIAAAPNIIATAPTPDIIIAPSNATAPTNANIDTTAIPTASQLTLINCCTANANTNTDAATSIIAAAPARSFPGFIFSIIFVRPPPPPPPLPPFAAAFEPPPPPFDCIFFSTII